MDWDALAMSWEPIFIYWDNSFVGISSDQRVVAIKIQLSLRGNKNKNATKPPYDWKHLCNNADIQNQLTITQNGFNQLQNGDKVLDSNNAYINFIDAHKQEGDESILLKPNVKHEVP